MLWCYLDDSGTDGTTPTIVMAGYIARLAQWRGFEREANRLFKRSKVERFHAKEFHDGKEAFAGWSAAKQLAFVQEWFDIAEKHVLAGITVSMVRETYEHYRKEHRMLPNWSAYGNCFDQLLNFLLADDKVGPAILDDGLSLFVEAGTKANDGVVDIFNKRKAGDGALFLHQLSLIDKNACRAIQLADFLAFYSRRHGTDYVLETGKGMSPFLELAKGKVRIVAQLADGFVPLSRKVSS